MSRKRANRGFSGFTIIELMIAMAFISLLLLAIAAAVMQIGAIYNKGITMKSVNQAGRLIVSDMKRVIGESQPNSVIYKPQDHNQGANNGSPDYEGGRLCTGVYTYIWNVGKHIDPDVPSSQANKFSGSDSDKPLRFVRVRDNGGQYCKDNARGAVQFSNSTELLSEGNLAIQDFHIDSVTNNSASGMGLYNISVVISDAAQEAINTVDNTCKPPSEDASYQNYCAVNQFDFTARAGNKGGQ